MKSIEKAPGGVSAPTEAMDTAACDGSTLSNYQSITGAKHRQGFVERLLPSGAENAIPTAALVKACGFSSARELQKQIEAERLHGALILSRSGNGGGYFLPSEGAAGQREIAEYVNTLRARALNTLRTLKTANAALEIIEGQETL